MFEDAGIPSVVIAVWKELVEQVKPPRALVVKAQFGSPMGQPGDVAHQSAVLCAALRLLDEVREPGAIVEFGL